MPFPSGYAFEVRLNNQALLAFDGVDDRIDSASAPTGVTGDVSVEAWVRMERRQTGGLEQVVVSSKRATAENGIQLVADESTGGFPAFRVRATDGTPAWKEVKGTRKITLRQWHHLAGTWNETTKVQRLYVDSEQVATATQTGFALVDPSEVTLIGAAYSGGTYHSHFKGRIRDVRLWTSARTAAEIMANRDVQLVGSESGLLDYYKLGEGSGTTANDSAGTANNGTISGATWKTGVGPLWTDLTADVSHKDRVRIQYGISGQGPTDRVGSMGRMEWAMLNSESNSVAKIGRYSVGHADALAGWEIGIHARFRVTYSGVTYYKFFGRMAKADPVPGTKRERVVRCLAYDWIDQFGRAKPTQLPVVQSQRPDQVLELLVDNTSEGPRVMDFDAGKETFLFALDDVRDNRTPMLQVAQRAVLSEFGFLMQIADTVAGGTLRFQNRHARVIDKTSQMTLSQADIKDMQVIRDPELIFNVVRASAYPRTVATSDEILATMDSTLEVGPGETERVTLHYRDPNNPDQKISGSAMNDPEGLNTSPNRGFETDVAGWSIATDGSGGSVARSTSRSKKGAASLLLTSGTTNPAYYRAQTSLITGYLQNDVVLVVAYVWVGVAWPTAFKVLLQEYSAADALLATTTIGTVTTPTTGWQRVAARVTLGDASTAKIRVAIGGDSGDFSGGAVTAYGDEVFVGKVINYEFSATPSGGGGREAELELIDSVMGGNSAEYQALNVGSSSGHVTQLRAKGRGVRTYNPIDRQATDATSQEQHDEREINLQLTYQTSPARAKDFADATLARYKNPLNWVRSVSFVANRSATLLAGGLAIEPGKRITLSEAVAAISGDYVIQGVGYEFERAAEGLFLITSWLVVLAATENYWLIGVTGSSEIGIATFAGF